MKRSWYHYSFQLLLFFALLAGTFLLVKPLSDQFDNVIIKIRDNLISNIEIETGLQVRYESLSPSILQSIQITNLEIFDPSSGTILASIEQASITYSLFKIITGNFSSAIEKIEINNGNLRFSLQDNSDILSYIQKTLAERKNEDSTHNKKSFVLDLSNTEIIIRNISLNYVDPEQNLSVFISFGTVGVIEEDFNYNLETHFIYSKPSSDSLKNISGNVTINGSLHRSFSRGISTVLLHSFDSPLASVSRLSVIAVYNSGTLTVNTVQDLQPVDIQLTWNIEEKRIDARLQCERLLPFKWISIKTKNIFLSNLSESEVSGVFHFTKEKDFPIVLDYELQALIPATFYGGGSIASKGILSGDEFELKLLQAQGKNINISAELVYNYKKIIPEGFASIQKLILPDGTFISGDLYFHPLGTGFSCIIPVLKINSALYSSVDLSIQHDTTTIDFLFSARDSTGRISAQASLIRDTQSFLQGYIALDAISVFDSFSLIQGIVSKKLSNEINIIPVLNRYAMTTEIYFSSDFSDVSFNCPRLVMAPLVSGDEYLLLSAKGNLEEIELFDIQYSGWGIDANGSIFAGFAQTGDVLFNASLLVNTIPFDFNGLFSNRVLSVYGDYSLAASALFDVVGGVSGSVQTKDFPIFINKRIFSLSIDTGFTFENKDTWKIIADSASIEEVTGLFPLDTIFSFNGYVDSNGAFLPEVTIADGFSIVEGRIGLSIIKNDDLGSRYVIDCLLDSTTSDESYSLSASLSGKEELFLESVFSLKSFPLMRIFSDQQKENLLTMQSTVSGSLDTLFATIDIEKIRYRLFDFDLEAHGSIVLEDKSISMFNTGAYWNGNSLSAVSGILDLSTMKADVTADWNAVLGHQNAGATIELHLDSFLDLPSVEKPFSNFFSNSLPHKFSVSSTVSKFNWGSVLVEHDLSATLIHEPGITAFYAGANDSISGFLLDDGSFSLSSAVGNLIEFQSTGSIQKSFLDIQVSNIYSDLSNLWNVSALELISINKGELKGNIAISGLLNDPDFQGILEVTKCFFTVPGYMKNNNGPVDFSIIAEGKEIVVPPFIIPASQGSLSINADILFDRWIPVTISSHIESNSNQAFKIDVDNDFMRASGMISTNIDFLLTNDLLSMTGKIGYEEGYLAVLFTGFNKQHASTISFNKNILLDLQLSVGKKVEFRWQPGEFTLIRGLIQAEKPIHILADTGLGSFQIKGTAGLRGGEVFYLKRNFYLREGSVFFNENQDLFDPFVTLRAEIRERDAEGNLVRIILSVENQPLSNFSPILTSDPIRSESDIIALLGQVTRGDLTRDNFVRDVIVASSDVLTQLSLFRNTENAIRDFLHLDLFSIRTLILQNAIFGQNMQTNTEKPLTIGNYFDNTTVYMGKYLGSAIYADALLHFSYFDPRLKINSGSLIEPYGNLLVQPELGFEVNTPLFLLHWRFSPENFDTLFVADNSITLSWKFSY